MLIPQPIALLQPAAHIPVMRSAGALLSIGQLLAPRRTHFLYFDPATAAPVMRKLKRVLAITSITATIRSQSFGIASKEPTKRNMRSLSSVYGSTALI
jgi:hypothetical protein